MSYFIESWNSCDNSLSASSRTNIRTLVVVSRFSFIKCNILPWKEKREKHKSIKIIKVKLLSF